MTQATFPALHALTLHSIVAMSFIVAPVFAAKPGAQSTDACTATENGSSTATVGNLDGSASKKCQVVQCGHSSTVTTGSGGLSGSTNLPDGSSVTIHTRSSGSRTSVATASSSSGDNGSSAVAVAGAGRGDDCIVTVTPPVNDKKSKQQKP